MTTNYHTPTAAAGTTMDAADVTVPDGALDAQITANVAAIGALQAEVVSARGGEASVDARFDAVEAAATAHESDTGNPHGVTAAQAGALPTGGGNLTGNLTANAGVTIDGRDVSADGQELDKKVVGGALAGDGFLHRFWAVARDTLYGSLVYSSGILTSATILWPDLTTGQYTVTAQDGNGYPTAWRISHPANGRRLVATGGVFDANGNLTTAYTWSVENIP